MFSIFCVFGSLNDNYFCEMEDMIYRPEIMDTMTAIEMDEHVNSNSPLQKIFILPEYKFKEIVEQAVRSVEGLNLTPNMSDSHIVLNHRTYATKEYLEKA